MIRRRPGYFRFHFRGRGGSWLALLGQAIALVGLPLPPLSAKDLSTPFPCQHRSCGCMSASDCWKKCCCFSASQRVAWAQEHSVNPPTELVEEAEAETTCCSESHDEDARTPSCCSTPKKPCCTAKKPTPVKKDKSSGDGKSKLTWVLTIQAKQCQGNAADEGDVAHGTVPVAPTQWHYSWILIASIPSLTQTPIAMSHVPSSPPPRG